MKKDQLPTEKELRNNEIALDIETSHGTYVLVTSEDLEDEDELFAIYHPSAKDDSDPDPLFTFANYEALTHWFNTGNKY